MRILVHKAIDRKLEELVALSRKRRKLLWLKKLGSLCICVWASLAIINSGRLVPLNTVSGDENQDIFVTSEASIEDDQAEAPDSQEKTDEATTKKAGFTMNLDTLLPKTEKATVSVTIKRGSTLAQALLDAGVSGSNAREMLKSIAKVQNLRTIEAGKEITISGTRHWMDGFRPETLEMQLSPGKQLTASLENGSYSSKVVESKLDKELYYASGIIHDSLFETATKMGIPSSRMVDMVNLYSYDLDLQRDLADGDKFEALIEKYFTAEGEFSHYGRVIYSSLSSTSKGNLSYYYFAGKDEDGDYYNDKGESIKKALLKTPMNSARITSGFGMRHHPVMGYTRMHRGIDFAAATGTPIFAAGDGVVRFAGRKSGYGNYIQISHNDKYQTAYAHLSRFATTTKNGARVKQGQVIGYVGSTGMSTGPHLHYEVHVNGEQVNPMKVKFASGRKLTGKELAEFKSRAGNIQTYVASIPKPGVPTKLASAR